MAEPTTSTMTMTVGAVGTVVAAKSSVVAQSLLQANFDQLVTGQFQLQMGDLISLIGVSVLLWNTFKHFFKRDKDGQ